jgi:hypothetical protein
MILMIQDLREGASIIERRFAIITSASTRIITNCIGWADLDFRQITLAVFVTSSYQEQKI